MKATSVFIMISLFALLLALPAAATESSSGLAPPDLPDSTMQVPWSDFKEILKKLTKAGQQVTEPVPPYDGVVTRANYRANVSEKGVEVLVDVGVIVLKKKGWASIPIIRTGVPISEAELDGKSTALVPSNDGMLHLVVQGAGDHSLSLKLGLDLSKNSGPEQFTIPMVKAQVNRISLKIGRPNLKIKISPNGHIQSETSGGSTLAFGSFPPTNQMTISWARSVPKSVKETARVSAEVRTMLTVGEGLGVYTAIVDYDIQHKPISEFAMTLPEDVTVADVSTEGLVDWKVEKTEQGQKLNVSIAFEAIGRHQVAVTYERALPVGDQVTLATADLKIEQIVHEIGYLAVAVRTNVQITPKQESLKNFAQVDPSELPPDLRGSGDQKVLWGFKYLKHPTAMDLEVVKHKDASVLTCEIELANYRIMVTESGKQLIEANYKIANRSLQYLTLQLPEGADLWGVYRDGKPVKAAEKNGEILLPVFKGGMNDTFEMKIIAYRKIGSLCLFGPEKILLPSLDVGASKIHLQLYLPNRLKYFWFGGSLRKTHAGSSSQGIKAMDGRAANEKSLLSLSSSGKRGDDSAYYSQDEETLEDNLRYRVERSQVQQMIVNAPVTLSNKGYGNTMTRGALAVEFDVAWEGRRYDFSTNIVDPEETVDVTFWYSKQTRSSIVWLVVLILAAWFGYFISRSILAFRYPSIKKPQRKEFVLCLVGLALALLLSVFRVGGKDTVIFGSMLGAIIFLTRWAILAIRKARNEKANSPDDSSLPPLASQVEEEAPSEDDEAVKGGDK